MTYKKWTSTELDFIKDNAGLMTDDELAVKLTQMTSSNISVPMIRTQRRKLGVKKPRGRQAKNKAVTITSNIVDSIS